MQQEKNKGEFEVFRLEDGKIGLETIRIEPSKSLISGNFSAKKFTDKDTNQIVLFMPSFDVSAYGETQEKANEMLKFSMHELFDHLLSLSAKNLRKELHEMGWKQMSLANKEYSKAYIDIDRQLQNFNAVDELVEDFALSIAA